MIISADWFNDSRDDYLLAAITSQLPTQPNREDVALSQADLQSAGLPRESVVKTGKIMAIQKGLIDRSLGRVPGATLLSVLERASDVLGLA